MPVCQATANSKVAAPVRTPSAPTEIAAASASEAPAPDVISAAHSHSVYGKTWSTLARLLDPITQDACAFYDDHALFDQYSGVVLDI